MLLPTFWFGNEDCVYQCGDRFLHVTLFTWWISFKKVCQFLFMKVRTHFTDYKL